MFAFPQPVVPAFLSFQKAMGRALKDVKVIVGVVRFGRVRDAPLMKLLDKLGKVVPET